MVEVSLPDNKKGYILQPRVVKNGYADFTSKMVSDVLARAVSNAESRSPNGMMFVFAAGNDGWNSETGEVEVFSQQFEGEDIHRYLNNDQRTDPQFLPANAPQIASTGTPANLPGPLSAAFIGNKQLQGIWLSVVATDRNNRITPFSNGCGEAANYCLAAPGAWVLSTVYSEDGDFHSYLSKTAYAQFQGTSMAAPMVSGAAAVVKGAYPNLTARQVVDILLRTATDLGAPGTDPVYGHGLLNLARALQPIGPTRAAADAFGVAACRGDGDEFTDEADCDGAGRRRDNAAAPLHRCRQRDWRGRDGQLCRCPFANRPCACEPAEHGGTVAGCAVAAG